MEVRRATDAVGEEGEAALPAVRPQARLRLGELRCGSGGLQQSGPGGTGGPAGGQETLCGGRGSLERGACGGFAEDEFVDAVGSERQFALGNDGQRIGPPCEVSGTGEPGRGKEPGKAKASASRAVAASMLRRWHKVCQTCRL